MEVKSKAKRFLIVGPAWVGDMVMAQTLFKVLMRRYPGSEIDVLAPAWSLPILQRMPEVAAAIEMPLTHGQLKLRQRFLLAKQLREKHYERAIILKNSFKSALIPFWAKIPQRIGYHGECRFGLLTDRRKLDKIKLPLMIQRFMALGLPPHATVPVERVIYPRLLTNAQTVSEALNSAGLKKPLQPLLALCPGAEYGVAKRWPAEHFATLANDYLKQGWQVWLLGSAKDQVITQAINTQTQNQCVDLAGKTHLAQAIDLLSLASLIVTNDSGLMHIACALNRPTVVLYGSSSPTFTPPLSNTVRVVSLALPCSPCFKRTCPFDHLKCLNELMPSLVHKAIQEIVPQAVVT